MRGIMGSLLLFIRRGTTMQGRRRGKLARAAQE